VRAYSLTHLSDGELRRDLASVAAQERSSTALVVAHIAEFETRRLYAPAGFPSMFEYCTRELHYSEQAALKRIRAARAARRFPAVLTALAEGRLHLSAVVLLKPHLTRRNAAELLEAASFKTRDQIEQLLAHRFPKADVPTRLQPLAPALSGSASAEQVSPGTVETVATANPLTPGKPFADRTPELTPPQPMTVAPPQQVSPGTPSVPFPKVTPLAPERFALQVTISKSTHDKLRHAQELLSHALPSGDLAQVLDRALDALICKLEKRKFGATDKPRPQPKSSRSKRHVPAHVRREVWERDQGQCTFVGDTGRRCEARKLVEYDHVDPIARGGIATVRSIRLRCRAHNQLEAERAYGDGFMHEKRETARRARAMSATPVPPSGSPARA
jgi:hypothetical protein